jgi:ABC-type transport system involved in cytochrome c biogenesis permease component
VRRLLQLARRWRKLLVMVLAEAVILAAIAAHQGLDLYSIAILLVCFALGVATLVIPSKWREERQ